MIEGWETCERVSAFKRYSPSKTLAKPIICKGRIECIWHNLEENVKKQWYESVNRETDKMLNEKLGIKRTWCKINELEILTVTEKRATALDPVGRLTSMGDIAL